MPFPENEFYPPVELSELKILFNMNNKVILDKLEEKNIKIKAIGRKTYVSVKPLFEYIDDLPKNQREYKKRLIKYNIKLARENKLLTMANLVRKMRQINGTYKKVFDAKAPLSETTNVNIDIGYLHEDLIEVDFDIELSLKEVQRIISKVNENMPRTFIQLDEFIKQNKILEEI